MATNGGNHIYNHNPGTETKADGNWWATPPATPDDVSAGVSTDSQLGDDPTDDTGCAMEAPEPLPQQCEVAAFATATKLRIQPALDDENWMLEVPDTYVYTSDTIV